MEQRRLPYFFQRADFSIIAHDPVDYAEALRAINACDWENELAYRDELKSKGRPVCDPGIIFKAAHGDALHVCPTGKGRGYFYYHYLESRRVLFVCTIRHSYTRECPDLSWSEMPDILYHYFMGNHQWFLYRTGGSTAPARPRGGR